MTFYRSIYVTKVLKLLAFIFEQPSYISKKDAEQLFRLNVKECSFVKCLLKKPTHGDIVEAKEIYIQLSLERYKGKF